MHVAERNRELERQRKQRQIRTRSFTRPQPTHGRHASRVSRRGRTILPVRACRFSNNVTFAKMRRCCDSSGVLQKINIPASTRPTAERATGTANKTVGNLIQVKARPWIFP
jgi:hypothetical protein